MWDTFGRLRGDFVCLSEMVAVSPYPVAAWRGVGVCMASLRIPLSDVSVAGFAIDTAVSVDSVRPESSETVAAESVRISGVLSKIDGAYLFRGRLLGSLVQPCDRCLEESRRPFEADLLWSFVKGKKDADRAGAVSDGPDVPVDQNEERAYQGHTIDLGPHVWEELVFAVPVKYLCRDDCLGLCPSCGANLNLGSCGCPGLEEESPSGPNRGLAGLAELFPDLAPQKEKE